MNDYKQQNAAYLFDAMGNLDDVLVTQAQTPVAARAVVWGRRKRRALLAAAMAFVVVTMSTVQNYFDPKKSADAVPTPITLEQTLMEAENRAVTVDPAAIDFFDSQTKLIWQGAEEDIYYCVALEGARDSERLQNALSKGGQPMSVGKEVPCSVWICYGDGTVVSPYLKSSPGNVGYGELFSYLPEIEPNNSFASLLSELLAT